MGKGLVRFLSSIVTLFSSMSAVVRLSNCYYYLGGARGAGGQHGE